MDKNTVTIKIRNAHNVQYRNSVLHRYIQIHNNSKKSVVDSIKGPKVAGIKGKLLLGAYETTLIDGRTIQLSGGYFKGRMALRATLAGVVFLPLIFIPCKRAKLPAGTVVDAYIDHPITLEFEDTPSPRTIHLFQSNLNAEIIYQQLEHFPDQADTAGSGKCDKIKSVEPLHDSN